MKTLHIPGNILLLGEYAILEEGGQGIAMGIAPFVKATVEPAEGFTIIGSTGSNTVFWDEKGGDPFLATAVTALTDSLKPIVNNNITELPLRIHLDSRAFFGSDGSKCGLGSSAAVVVALVVAVINYLHEKQHKNEVVHKFPVDLLQTVVDVHRAVQGGQGSGYDVAASLYGGMGLFTGGKKPQWHAFSPPFFPSLQLFRGKKSVSTLKAITHFEQFRHRNPHAFNDFIQASNHIVRAFVKATSWQTMHAVLEEARQLALTFGNHIHVPALPPSDTLFATDSVTKCLGAGDELIALFSNPVHSLVYDHAWLAQVAPKKSEGLVYYP
ncbi:mevalonate kinase family protein [Legionella fairfieldensis]|uniref:mevalonate kinase family protein n=1 Tax=Legionella fairfieldensis TaxID=45064 RepID=UPI0004920C4C|nr:hypothetical protein [Legionella fairfieldensis]